MIIGRFLVGFDQVVVVGLLVVVVVVTLIVVGFLVTATTGLLVLVVALFVVVAFIGLGVVFITTGFFVICVGGLGRITGRIVGFGVTGLRFTGFGRIVLLTGVGFT